ERLARPENRRTDCPWGACAPAPESRHSLRYSMHFGRHLRARNSAMPFRIAQIGGTGSAQPGLMPRRESLDTFNREAFAAIRLYAARLETVDKRSHLAYAMAYANRGGDGSRTTRQAFQERPKPGSADSPRVRASWRGRDHEEGGRMSDHRARPAENPAGAAGDPCA